MTPYITLALSLSSQIFSEEKASFVVNEENEKVIRGVRSSLVSIV